MRTTLLAFATVTATVAAFVVITTSGAVAAPGAIAGCPKNALKLVKPGQLTIGADNPAYPPWFGGDEKAPWKVSDPSSGQGYESAVAYAVASQLGFKKSEVEWIHVPFNNSYRPGKKPFDFYVTQVSFSPARAKAVNFSQAYYFVNQAVVGRKGTPIAKAKRIRDLKTFTLGAQVGTTSYAYIQDHIKPESDPLVFDDNDKAIQALKNGQIHGIVVDLPTAFYVTAAQLDDGVIVGKLPTKGTKERFGLVLQKGSVLTGCVNKAINRLWRNGTIRRLQNTWLAKAGAPDLK